MITIATRIYPVDDIRTGIEYEALDITLRNDDGASRFTTDGHPGEPDSVAAYRLSDVFEWLQDMPEQIVRAVHNSESR